VINRVVSFAALLLALICAVICCQTTIGQKRMLLEHERELESIRVWRSVYGEKIRDLCYYLYLTGYGGSEDLYDARR